MQRIACDFEESALLQDCVEGCMKIVKETANAIVFVQRDPGAAFESIVSIPGLDFCPK